MIKVVFCLRKRDDMTREQFFDYWHGHHAALSHKTRAALGVRRYVQNLTVSSEVSAAANEAREHAGQSQLAAASAAGG